MPSIVLAANKFPATRCYHHRPTYLPVLFFCSSVPLW
jgi:hypothetical protein